MRRTVIPAAALCIVSGLLLGVGWAAAASVGSLAEYFPLVPGTAWTFRTNTHGEIVMRVGETARVGSHDCRMVETIVGGNTTQRECYRVTAEGVYAHQRTYPAGSVTLTPPQRMLATPVIVGETWQWKGRIDNQPITMNFTWARREATTVPAGTYQTMQLYFVGQLGDGVRIQSWRWFAPKIGMVKEDSVVTQGTQTIRIYAELLRVATSR
jgi:hypothetical protein